MRTVQRERIRLLAGLVLSLALHLLVLSPLLLTAMGAGSFAPPMEAIFEPEQVSPPLPPDEAVLGQERPAASTMTWIGYEQYQEHLATLSEVEQAAQQLNDPSASMPILTAEASAAPPDGETSPAESAQPQELLAQADAMSLEAMLRELGFITPLNSGNLPAPQTANDPAIPLELQPEQSAHAPTPAPEQPVKQLTAQSTVQDAPASESQQPDEIQAEKSDREAEPTSTIEVPPELWKTGKPLAAQGLSIQTRRPQFSILTRMTASVCDPVFELRFRRDGRPSFVGIIKDSCDSRVDSELITTLYRWRASGIPLESLEGDETINVRMQILLRGR